MHQAVKQGHPLLGLLALGLASCSAPAPDAGGDQCPAPAPGPLVSAHRGGAAYAPENTLAALANAVRLSVDELELDTQLSADGQLVVIHDDSVDRTTDCSGAVGSLTLAELQACDAAYWFSPGQATTTPDTAAVHPLRGHGIRIPSLQQVLDWHATLPCPPRLSIELKNIPGESNFDPLGQTLAKAIVPLLSDPRLLELTTVQSFLPTSLEAVKRLEPRLRTQFLTSSGTGQTAAVNLAYVISGGHQVSAPNFDAPDFGPAFVAAAQAAGKAVVPYTPDARDAQQGVLDSGVDGLISNYPACTLLLLGRSVPTNVTPAGVPPIPACPPE